MTDQLQKCCLAFLFNTGLPPRGCKAKNPSHKKRGPCLVVKQYKALIDDVVNDNKTEISERKYFTQRDTITLNNKNLNN